MTRRDALYALTKLSRGTLAPAPNRRTVAFNYAAHSSLSDLEFLANFDLVVIGGVLGSDQTSILKRNDSKLVLYRWASALYPGEGTRSEHEWEYSLRQNGRSWLLSGEPVGGGAAASGKVAYWYDFGMPQLSSAFAAHIRDVVQANRYDGVFLDTLGFDSLPPQMKERFKARHKNLDYDHCQASFLSHLRQQIGSRAIIFTNQGYRKPDDFLRESNLDLIENSVTYLQGDGSVILRPWLMKGAEWDSIKPPLFHLVEPAVRRFPNVGIVHINYCPLEPVTFERALRYSEAIALLWNQTSFLATPGIQKPVHSELYFEDWGEPLDTNYREDEAANVAWRRFEQGAVAINGSNQTQRLAELEVTLPAGPRGFLFRRRGTSSYVLL